MLERLINISAPSAREHTLREYIAKELEPVAEVSTDPMGNLIAHIPGDGKKLLLAAHMDEIGLMITFVDEKGFLRFAPIGGITAPGICYHRIVLPSGREGVISFPQNIKPESLKLSDMFIDIGATDSKDAEKYVSVGDMATFQSHYYEDETRIVSGKLDDRLGCMLLLELAKKVKNPTCDLYLAFTVQEEIGLRGAAPATFGIEPYMAIALDVTSTGDTPDSDTMAVSLGKGVAIKVKDGKMVAAEKVRTLLENICKEENLPYQLEVLSGGTTDSAAMQTAGIGTLAGAVSIPTRYIHTTSETAAKADICAAGALLEKLVMRGELK